MPENTCLPRATLKEYLAGWTDAERSLQIEEHLSQCESCEETIVALEREPDTLAGLLISASGAADSIHPSSLASAAMGQPLNESSAAAESLQQALSFAANLIHQEEHQSSNHANSNPFSANWRSQIGPYQLLKPLGHGGMGSVFLARHQQLGKQVAIKLLPLRQSDRAQFVARFQREIRAAGGLDHPSIVSATDAGEEAGTHFLVMEFIDGLDLSQLSRIEGRLAIADACELIRQVALGLSHAHSAGIVHRDIKPSNLMLNRRGQVKILDFGLARLGPWNDFSTELTTVGQLMGTLDYMSPEQAERADAVDYRADIYSLGATLFRLICGRAPLAASPDQSPLAKLRLLATQSPPKLSTLRPDAPEALAGLVEEMLARDPNDRPASAAHVAQRLEEFCPSAQLVNLVEHATAAKMVNKPSCDIAPEVRFSSLLASDQMVSPRQPSKPRYTRATWSWIATACLAIAGLIYAGITIWIDGQQGWLHIDSEARVTVDLISDGAPAKQWRVEPGENVTRLYAGKYRIVLEQGSDGVELNQDQLQIVRRGVAIAKISKSAPVGSMLPTSATSDSTTRTSDSPRLPPASTAILMPGDALIMSSMTDDKLRHSFVVQADQTVKVPLLGTLSVKGMTVDQLQSELEKGYRSHLKRPGIEVFRDLATSTRPQPSSAPQADSTSLANANVPESIDAEPTNKGRPLSEWLRLVQTERNPAELEAALKSLPQLTTREGKQRIVDFLKRELPKLDWAGLQTPNGRSIYHTAFGILMSIDRPDYFPYISQQLEQADETWAECILREAIPLDVNAVEFEPIQGWMVNSALPKSSRLSKAALACCLRLNLSPSSEGIDQWIPAMINSPNLSDIDWFESSICLPKSSSELDRNMGKYWRIIVSRAIVTLSKPEVDAQNIVYASAALCNCPEAYLKAEEEKLDQIWKLRVGQLVESDELRLSTVRFNHPFFLPKAFELDRSLSFDMNLSYARGNTPFFDIQVQFALAKSLGKKRPCPPDLLRKLIPGAASFMGQLQIPNPWSFIKNEDRSHPRSVPWPLSKSSEQFSNVSDFVTLLHLNVPEQSTLEQLLQPSKQAQVERQFAKLGLEKNQGMDLDTFRTFKKGYARLITDQVFVVIDSNNDRKISVDEYLQYLDSKQISMYSDDPIRLSDPDLMDSTNQIGKYDKDNDGRLSKDEMSKMLVPPDDTADQNQDGFVDVFELRDFNQHKRQEKDAAK